MPMEIRKCVACVAGKSLEICKSWKGMPRFGRRVFDEQIQRGAAVEYDFYEQVKKKEPLSANRSTKTSPQNEKTRKCCLTIPKSV